MTVSTQHAHANGNGTTNGAAYDPTKYSKEVNTARDYYNSDDADTFYHLCWGDGNGDHIHVGLYAEPQESIPVAAHRTVTTMASALGLNASMRVLDAGAGYGGSARELAKTYGCHVTCLNLSDVENARNVRLCRERGLDKLVDVIDGSYEEIPFEDGSFDAVWSMDAFLHSGDRLKALKEIKRVLKPGGQFIFTDLMASNNPNPAVMQPILNRLHLTTLGCPGWYQKELEKLGGKVQYTDHTDMLTNHYRRVGEVLQERRHLMKGKISDKYIDTMSAGLDKWVSGGRSGDLAWGITHCRF